jgi:hypothetical protein
MFQLWNFLLFHFVYIILHSMAFEILYARKLNSEEDFPNFFTCVDF